MIPASALRDVIIRQNPMSRDGVKITMAQAMKAIAFTVQRLMTQSAHAKVLLWLDVRNVLNSIVCSEVDCSRGNGVNIIFSAFPVHHFSTEVLSYFSR